MNDFGGLEVWRGGVNTWECDDMGHLNVRFYVARAMEGLVGLAGALGLDSAFREQATATLLPNDYHIRFLKEARSRTPLHMVAGVLEMRESHARFLQLLVHSITGELAASFQCVVAHATVREGRSFPWSAETLRRAERYRMTAPDKAAPRSLDLNPVVSVASLEEADRMNLFRIGAGAVGADDCDIFGRMRPDIFMGRVSDGVPTLGMALQKEGEAPPAESGARVGGAVLEYRVAYHTWPRSGDRFVIHSGLAAVGDRTQRLVHWMLDPETGKPWATAEAIAIALNLETRKIIPISVGDQAHLRGRVTPGLAL